MPNIADLRDSLYEAREALARARGLRGAPADLLMEHACRRRVSELEARFERAWTPADQREFERNERRAERAYSGKR